MSSAPLYRDALIELIRQEAQPREKFTHQPRLYALACQIGEGEPYDDDVLFAAAWLHDLGVFIGHRPADPEELTHWDNTAYAMQRAPEILQRLGFPNAKVGAVVECIRTHQPHSDPAAIEGILLRDADILEQLGAVGILRTVCKIGRDTRFPTFAEAVASLRHAAVALPAKIKTARARSLATRREAVLQQFLESADAESQGSL